MIGSMMQLLQKGTYEILVHAALDLEYPVDEVFLLALEATRILGVLYGA